MEEVKTKLKLLEEDLIKYTKQEPKREVPAELMILRVKDILKCIEKG